MLSNNSICNNCDVKEVCKHYSYAISNIDIDISITKCKINKNINKIKQDVFKMPESNVNTTVPNPLWNKDGLYIKSWDKSSSLYDAKIESNKFDKIKEMKVTTVEEPKATCEACGKLAVLSHCTDCGKRICSQCGYTMINVNTGKPEITCDNCFDGGNKNDEVDNTDWTIDKFIEEAEVVIEEEKDNAKSTRKQSTNKRSTKKSKSK